MAKKIYDNSRWYSCLKFLAGFYIRGAFSRIQYTGVESIPGDGAVIFAPNHCNGFVDPMAVINMTAEPKVFLSRADIFKGARLNRIFNFLKMLPVHRRIDGLGNVRKSAESFGKAVEVLKHRMALCLFPEGTHRPKHALLPMGKGVARVAFDAVREIGADFPVYVVPVGLEYGDYYRYRSTLLVNVAPAFNVTDYIFSHPELSEAEIFGDIRRMLDERIGESIVCVRREDHYDEILELSDIFGGERSCALNLIERFKSRRKAVKHLEEGLDSSPSDTDWLLSEVSTFFSARRKAGISISSLSGGRYKSKLVLHTLLSILALPVFLVSAVVSLPVWAISEIIASKMEDAAFRNSIRLGAHIFLWTAVLLAWTIFFFCRMKWYWALPLALAVSQAPKAVYDYFNLVNLTLSDWRTLFHDAIRNRYEKLSIELNTKIII